MLKLKDLVFVEDSATLIPDVQISFFYDEKNTKLVKSYVHGRHDIKSGNSETSLSIINKVINNDLSSKGKPSRFLIISDYGCGKSHLGVMLANFFSLKPEDKLMQIFFDNVQKYSGNDFKTFIESYKKTNKPKLPILLSGESIEDLKTEVQKSLQESLYWFKKNYDNTIDIESKGSTDNAYSFFLNFKGNEKENLINEYLQSNHKIDFTKLLQELEHGNNDYLNYAKACAEEVLNISTEFGDKSLEEILQNTIAKYCTEDNHPFSGILIVFDEFGQYIDKFRSEDSPISYKLGQYQQLTNVCGKLGQKIHLIQFIQQSPDARYAYLSPNHEIRKYLERMGERIIFSSTLEHVIDRIIIQEYDEKGELNNNWNEFIKRSEVQDITNNLNLKALNIFNSGNNNYGWTIEELKRVVTLGCYPMHPMSVYLLCHSLTKIYQGNRSIINLLKNKLIPFLEREAINSNSNELEIYYPSMLIEDLKDYIEAIPRDYENAASVSSIYQQLKAAIIETRFPNELKDEKKQILNAIFLSKTFFSEWNELKSFKNIYDLIEWLTGISQDKVKYVCEKLEQDKVISSRYGVFEFINKGNINTIEEKLQEIYDARYKSYKGVIDSIFESYFKQLISDKINLRAFFNKFNIHNDFKEYWAPQKIFLLSPELINDKYNFEKIIKSSEESKIRSSIILIKTQSNVNFDFIKNQINNIFNELGNQKHKLIIAASSASFDKVETLQIKMSILNKDPLFVNSKYKEEISNLVQDFKSKISEEIKSINNNILYFVEENTYSNLSDIEKKDISSVICKLYECNYNKIAPYSTDKFLKGSYKNPKHFIKLFTQGKINTQELNAEFISFLDMFMKGKPGSWEVLDKSYNLTSPTNNSVKEAYEIINNYLKFQNNKNIDLKDVIHKIKATLYKMPYGYDEPAFWLLFSVWLGVNSNEIEFRKNGGKFHPKNLPIKPTKFFEDWEKELLNTQISKIEAPNYTEYLKDLETCKEFEKAKELINKFDPITINNPEYFSKIKNLVESLKIEVEPIDNFIVQLDTINKKINENINILKALHYLIDLNRIIMPEIKIIENIDLLTLNQKVKTNAINACEKLIKKELEVLSSNSNIKQKDSAFNNLTEFIQRIGDSKEISFYFTNNIHNITEQIERYKNERVEKEIDENIYQPCREIINNNKPIRDAEEFIEEITNNEDYADYDDYKNEAVAQLVTYIGNKKEQFENFKNKINLINSDKELYELKQEYQSLMLDIGRSSLHSEAVNFQNELEGISRKIESFKTLANNAPDFKALIKLSTQFPNEEFPENIYKFLNSVKENKLNEIRENLKTQLNQTSMDVERIDNVDGLQRLRSKLNAIKEKSQPDDVIFREILPQINILFTKLTEFETQNKSEQILFFFKELPKEKQKELINQLNNILLG